MKIRILMTSFMFGFALFAFNTGEASANSCNFYRDLGQGMRGEDVRCLQANLIANGHLYGVADGIFGPVTRGGVVSWQSANGLFPSGYFDSNSRAQFLTAWNNGGGIVLGDSIVIGSQELRARQKIEQAITMIDNARNQIKDGNKNKSSAENRLDDAEEKMMQATRAFIIHRNFTQAFAFADQALQHAEDAFEGAGGDTDRDDVEEMLEDLQDDIDDAQDEINEAQRQGQSVLRANDILDDARDELDEAWDEFDDRNYDEAEEIGEDVEDLIEDALDEIDGNTNNDRDSARRAIDDAEDAIDDAEDAIDDAKDDGEYVGYAEDLLDDAKDALDEAYDAFDDEDYDEAEDLADEAKELAEDAEDEVN